mgnify:CR=1 FL=1
MHKDHVVGVLWAWLIHIPACALVVWLLVQVGFSIWAYLIAAYGGLSLLKIRTYAEHRAHENWARAPLL